MSDRSDSEFGIEQPSEDVADQRRDESPPVDRELEPIEDMPVEANEADVVDQHRVVPVDDEDPGLL